MAVLFPPKGITALAECKQTNKCKLTGENTVLLLFFFFNTRFNICLKLTNPAGNSQVLFFFPIQTHSWLSLRMLVWVTVTWQQGGIWVVGRAIPEPQICYKNHPKNTPKTRREGEQSTGRWRGELESPSSCCWELPPPQSSHLSPNKPIPAMPGGTASSVLPPSGSPTPWAGHDHMWTGP